ncbi:MAG: glycosyltransferase family 39 protein [Planctomycetia bacterium]|nr:glycosyltransferase family 39 protein [Planctomycetia bacterium]
MHQKSLPAISAACLDAPVEAPGSAARDLASPRFRRRMWLVMNIALLLLVATFWRAVALDHVPGVNGDEAWLAVQAQRWLGGEAVTWRTPTGNPLNVFNFLPLAALHLWLPPSVIALRLTAVLCGVLALGVNYLLCRWVFGRRLAIVSTIVLAVLPTCIAYSRLAWDSSQTLLFMLPVIYLPLAAITDNRRRVRCLLAAAVAMAAAAIVHPTNIFAAPLLCVAAIYCWREELRRLWQRPFFRQCSVAAGLLVFAALGCGLLLAPRSIVGPPLLRLVQPRTAGQFMSNLIDLLSGTTVYRYMAGSQENGAAPDTLAYRLAACALLAIAAFGVWSTLRCANRSVWRVLAIGWGLGLAAFYVIGGPAAIQPHYERYGMWLMAPTALLISQGLAWWLLRRDVWRIRPALALLPAWVLLAGFSWNYFDVFARTGGESHVAFRTARVEPKVLALQLMESRQPNGPVRIVAEDWWSYWPLAYLAGGQHDVTVIPAKGVDPRAVDPADQRDQPPAPAAWRVRLVDGYDGASGWMGTKPGAVILDDAGGRPLMLLTPPQGADSKVNLSNLRRGQPAALSVAPVVPPVRSPGRMVKGSL